MIKSALKAAAMVVPAIRRLTDQRDALLREVEGLRSRRSGPQAPKLPPNHMDPSLTQTGVSKVISPNDTMLDNGKDEYLRIGKLGLDICKAHLKGRTPARILDFPSGYGRVMRWFQNEWPHAELFAAEIDAAALDFIESAFGAKRVPGDHHLRMSIPSSMDLIFSGSLLTHLDHWQWDLFLEMCANALAENGILVFTTHGRIAAHYAKVRHSMYGNLIDTLDLYQRYKETGFAFLPYSKDYPTYGLTLSSPEWVMRQLQRMPNIKIIAFEEGAWGQDVVVVQRNPWPMVV